ncbi:hypothetical protein BDF21DRAFT_108422 [Thamnidium elegans]|nr:hypothetical protein BDF21DRAFT_108422 [Thamnidium elegans]
MTLEQVRFEYKCYNCQKPCIRGDPSLIRAVGNLYHKQCFKCNTCQISVIDKFFILDDESSIIVCEKDYYQLCGFKCHQYIVYIVLVAPSLKIYPHHHVPLLLKKKKKKKKNLLNVMITMADLIAGITIL